MTRKPDTTGHVIRRTFWVQKSEEVTLAEFMLDVVQDEQVATDICFKMVEGDGTYEYGEDPESIYFEKFEIIDKEGLLYDLGRVPEEGITWNIAPDPALPRGETK